MLVSQGVPQNLKPYDTVKLVEPMQVPKVDANGKPVLGPDGKQLIDTVTEQTIAQGPVASQEIIKEFGTNGGGFFNANSSHPYENPTPLSAISSRCCRIFAIGAGPHLHAGPNGRVAAPWLGRMGGNGHSVPGGRYRRVPGRGARQPAC